MNLLAHIENKVWLIREQEFNAMRLRASSEKPDMSKVAADYESMKAARENLPLAEGMRARLKTGSITTDNTAIINIQGAIFNVEGYFDELIAFYFGGTSYQDLMKDIETVKNNPEITSVGVKVHSPGGEAFGMLETANLLAGLSKQKPTIGYAYGMACSAAFGLISATGKVVADAGAWIGSVGVVTQWADFTGFYEKMGIAYEEVTSENAPFKRLDIRKPEHRAVLMSEINPLEGEFIKLLAKNMNVSVDKVKSDFGQGAVKGAREAKTSGMINEIGSWQNVLKELRTAAKKVNRAGTSAEINEGEINMSWGEQLNTFLIEKGWKAPKADVTDENPETAKSEEPAATEAPKSEAPTVDLAAEKANLAAERETVLADKAKNFADAEVTANRLLPAERGELEASYLQALQDDAASPLAEGSRAAKLEAMQSRRQPHHFTQEKIAPDATAKVLAGDSERDVVTDTQKVLATTPLGRAALKVVK